MKIGFDAKRLFHNHTGLGNYSRTLVQNIQHFHPENEYNLYAPKLSQNFPSFLNKEQYNNYFHQSSFPALWRSFGIKNQLKKDTLGIYHGLSNELPFGIHKTPIKTIVTIHDLIFKVLPNTYPLVDRKIYDFKFRNACQQADLVLAISENTKQDIIDYYNISPNKIEVLYQACLPIFYKNEEKENLLKKYALPKDYILVVGGLGKRKNLDLLLDAQQQLPSDLQIPIVLVDKGKAKSVLKQRIQQLEEKKQLFWLKNVSQQEELKQLYQQATLLVYPSLYEGFGLPIVEALLCKTPVITAKNSSLKEAGGPDSLYINAQNAAELKLAIQSILQSEELKKKMISNGLEYAQTKFNPQKLSQQLQTIYTQLL